MELIIAVKSNIINKQLRFKAIILRNTYQWDWNIISSSFHQPINCIGQMSSYFTSSTRSPAY